MNFPTALLVIFAIFWISKLIKTSYSRARRSRRLPPGPYQYPIIGNILSLGPKPHCSLARLARQYGPVMSLKLGSMTTVVISSPEATKVVFQKHDLALSSRSVPTAITPLAHDAFSLAWLPVGDQWRKLRKISKEQLFTGARLDAGRALRKEKLQKLVSYVEGCGAAGRAVNIGEAAFTTALNLMSATLFSVEFAQFESDSMQEIRDVMWQVMKCVGKPNLADYFPFLKGVDPLGIFKEAEIHVGKMYAILDEIINERLRSKPKVQKKSDMVQALINPNQLTPNEINHLLMDLIIAGTETTSGTVEWAMTELLRHPEKISRVRDEIKTLITHNGIIEESNIPQLSYLQAVVKETFRLHPPLPVLLPRKAESDVEINGYLVPKSAQVLINAWAIGKDPSFWAEPERFWPERFLNEEAGIDFRGQDFELIPFGAGRRICPGLPLAYRMVHLMVAALVGNFEWELDGMQLEKIDMGEKFGLSVSKATPLTAIPTKFEFRNA